MEKTKEFYISDDGIRLHSKLDLPEAMPEKCPLAIIIHGFTGHMEETHIIGLAETFLSCGIAALRVEMYGHGGSDGLFENHTLFKCISNVNAAVDYAKSLDFVTDLYLCGHSQGGFLTSVVAGMRPDDFKAILPLSPALFIGDCARSGNFIGSTFDPAHIPEYIIANDLRLNACYLRVAQCIYPEKIYPNYKGPVLIVHGNADESVPVEIAIEAAPRFENCKLVLIDGDDHCYNYHLDKVLDAVKDFITSR